MGRRTRRLVLGLLVGSFLFMGVQAAAAATTWVVDDDGAQCPTADFNTISAAVVAAGDGDTIEVCPGTYVENIILSEDLTLEGAQAGVDACGRMSPAESTVTAPLGTLLRFLTGSAGATVDGFTFFGGNRGIDSDTGPIDRIELLNNRVRGFTGTGVFLDDNGINITAEQNEIDGTFKVGGGGLFHLDQDNFDGFRFLNNCVVNGTTGTGFFVDGNRNVDNGSAGSRVPQFIGNFIDNNGTGANLGRFAWGDGPISGNTFSDNVFDGLQGGPKNSLIEQNNFEGNGGNGLALTGFGGAGDPTRGAQNNDILRNCFTGNGTGIFFTAGQFPGTISTNEAHQNNISGNSTGARYLGAETIPAELNWWGSPTGPFDPVDNPSGTGNAVVDVGNGIDFIPFRTTPVGGTPCLPVTTPGCEITITNGGWIYADNGDRGIFGGNAKADADGNTSGNEVYEDKGPAQPFKLHGDVLSIVCSTDSTEASIFGVATIDGVDGHLFQIDVKDLAEPGKGADTYRMRTTGYDSGENTLEAGNVNIRRS
jgi:hypothetical protein